MLKQVSFEDFADYMAIWSIGRRW